MKKDPNGRRYASAPEDRYDRGGRDRRPDSYKPNPEYRRTQGAGRSPQSPRSVSYAQEDRSPQPRRSDSYPPDDRQRQRQQEYRSSYAPDDRRRQRQPGYRSTPAPNDPRKQRQQEYRSSYAPDDRRRQRQQEYRSSSAPSGNRKPQSGGRAPSERREPPRFYSYRTPQGSGRKPQRPEPRSARPSYYDGYSSSGQRKNASVPNRKTRKKPSRGLLIFLVVLTLLLAAGVFLAIPVVKTKAQASALKSDFGLVVDAVKAKDAESAGKALSDSYEDREKLAESIHSGFWNTFSFIGPVEKELKNADALLEIVTEVQDDLLSPLIALMREQPLSNMKVGEAGFNVVLINRYLDLAEELMPKVRTMAEKVSALDSDSMIGGTVAAYQDKISALLNSYDEASVLLPLLRTVIGHGENRLYLFVAQNSAEIRASGGFPGSIGTIRIQDGVLSIGGFRSVYQVLAPFISEESDVTGTEESLFGSWVNAPRDACFIPEFERTAHIWAVAYEDYLREAGALEHYNEDGTIDRSWHAVQEPFQYYEEDYLAIKYDGITRYVEYVDGVISMTPAIIQMLLADVGEITLFDGTVLNAENATRVLQHELYHKYYDMDAIDDDSNYYADLAFAETAGTAMGRFVGAFDPSKFTDYYHLFKQAGEERILMMWMRDEEEQRIIEASGVSGNLNRDINAPQNGIYFSLSDPGKMGWYLDIVPEIGEPVINDDGSRTYDVKLTLRNTIDYHDVHASHEYIIGSYEGSIRGFVHIFAPAGGYISDMDTENYYTYTLEDEYKDLEVYYNLDLLIDPGEEEIFYYKVTTAPGVETPLQAVTTPTLTKYR